MELGQDVVDDVQKRLRRIAGQVQGVERMLVEGRECREVVAQLSAATKALEQAGFKLVAVRSRLLRGAPRTGGGGRLRDRRSPTYVHEAGVRGQSCVER